MIEWIVHALGLWWLIGRDGGGEAGEFGWRYVVPVFVLVAVLSLGAMLFVALRS